MLAVVNDAMNPDSSLEKKKKKRENSNMFLFLPGQKHTLLTERHC